MKRLACFVAALAAVSGFALVGTTPASAHLEACVGQGNANVNPGLNYPVVGSGQNSAWDITLNPATAVCTPGAGNQAAGTLSGVAGGFCGHSYSTSGVSNSGHSIAYTSAGSILVIGASPLGNGVSNSVGVANAIPNALAGSSCATPNGATVFLVTGVIVGLP